jgi:hypothetical protein
VRPSALATRNTGTAWSTGPSGVNCTRRFAAKSTWPSAKLSRAGRNASTAWRITSTVLRSSAAV